MSNEFQVFIFNYAHFEQASQLFYSFTDLGFDTYWLNCASNRDPSFPETEKIRKLPNIYYSGQWNEALKYASADVIFLINADVRFNNIDKIVYKLKMFYQKHGPKAGIYAPNIYWTPWTYNPSTLKDLGDGFKRVPNTDSTIWAVKTSIAHKIGPIDLKVNRLGWGIEQVASYYCDLENKYVVRDYAVKCDHPAHTAYDRGQADVEFRRWIEQLKLGKDFWKYYDSRDHFGFGCGDCDIPREIKLM